MNDWLPGAQVLPATEDGGPQVTSYPPRLVLHTTEGNGSVGQLAAYYHTSTYWPHFTADPVRKQIAQHIPYSRGGRALSHTTATQTNDAHCIQVEIIGFAAQAGQWPADQVDWLGHTLGPVMDTLGIHRIAPPFLPYPQSAGASPVRMSEAAWASFSGVCGHQHVPENDHGDPGAFNIGRFLTATKPAPLPPETPLVAPRFNPPLDLTNVADWIYDPAGGRGVYLLQQNGALFAFGTTAILGVNGQSFFAGRTAERLDNPTAAEANAGKKIAIIDSAGERYACPF